MNSAKKLYLGTIIMACLALCGCGSDIAVSAQKDGSTSITLNTDIGQTVGSLINALYGLSGSSGAPNEIINPKQIEQALTQSGYQNTSVKSEGTKLFVQTQMPKNSASALITNTGKSLTVRFLPLALRDEYESMPEDAKAYLDLLMAPVLTGEELSKDEYIVLIKSAYGNDMAQELVSSEITLTLSSPDGQSKKFSIPLVDFLTFGQNGEDDKDFEFSIAW